MRRIPQPYRHGELVIVIDCSDLDRSARPANRNGQPTGARPSAAATPRGRLTSPIRS